MRFWEMKFITERCSLMWGTVEFFRVKKLEKVPHKDVYYVSGEATIADRAVMKKIKFNRHEMVLLAHGHSVERFEKGVGRITWKLNSEGRVSFA